MIGSVEIRAFEMTRESEPYFAISHCSFIKEKNAIIIMIFRLILPLECTIFHLNFNGELYSWFIYENIDIHKLCFLYSCKRFCNP